MTFHLPYTKMGKKALKLVLPDTDEATGERLQRRFEASTRYCRRVGNIYTGSLYLGLLSLLDNDTSLKAGDRIGLFSYGSGAVAEFLAASCNRILPHNCMQPIMLKCWLIVRN